MNWPAGARMTIPGNAEWALWFVVEILFAIIWAASDPVDAAMFVIVTAIITFAYLISRGIAKAVARARAVAALRERGSRSAAAARSARPGTGAACGGVRADGGGPSTRGA